MPAKSVEKTAAGADTWVTTFAMLTLSGVGLEMSAERLGKPLNVLKALFETVQFQSLLKNIALETGKDAAVALLKSSAVDNVLTMIKLRDSAQSETVRLKSASQLLQWNYFHQNSSSLPEGTSVIHDALRKSGLDVNDSVDRELERLVKNSPVLLSKPLLASLIAPKHPTSPTEGGARGPSVGEKASLSARSAAGEGTSMCGEGTANSMTQRSKLSAISY